MSSRVGNTFHDIPTRVDFECRLFLCRIHIDNQAYVAAQSILQELAKQQSQAKFSAELATDTQFLLGGALRGQKKYQEAISAYRKITDGNMKAKLFDHCVARSYHAIGGCLWDNNQFGQAEQSFELAIEHFAESPRKSQSRFFLSRCQHLLGKHEKARVGYSVASEETSDLASRRIYLYWRGKSFFDTQDWQHSSTNLETAYNLGDKSWPFHLECQHYLGRSYFEMGGYDKGRAHFQDICTLHEKPTRNVPETVLDSQLYLGRCLFELGQIVNAENTFIRLLEAIRKQRVPMESSLMCARFELGRCYAKMANFAKAMEEFEAVVIFFEKRSPVGEHTYIRIQYERGLISQRTGKLEQALSFYNLVLAKCKADTARGALYISECRLRKAHVLMLSKRPGEASQLYRQVFNMPGQTSQLLRLGKTELFLTGLVSQREYEEALMLANEVLKWQEEVSEPDSLSHLTWQLHAGGLMFQLLDFEKANQTLSKSLSKWESLKADQKKLSNGANASSFYAQHALSLRALDQPKPAETQAAKALEEDVSPEHTSCQKISGFMEVFGGLLKKNTTAISGMNHPVSGIHADQLNIPQPLSLPVREGPKTAAYPEMGTTSNEVRAEDMTLLPKGGARIAKKKPPTPRAKPQHLILKYGKERTSSA